MEEMKAVYVPIEEQETTISFSRSGTTCNIWTSDQTTITKLDKLCKTAPQNYKVVAVGTCGGRIVNKEYLIQDKTFISFRSGKVKREYTEEQRKALSEKMKLERQKGKL